MNSPDILISLVILAALGAAVALARSQGAANPVGTAKLQTDMTALSARVGKIESTMKGIRGDLDRAPTKEDIARLEGQIQGAASKVDIARLEGRIETVSATSMSTDQAVIRIEKLLMDRALPANGGRA